MSEADRPRRKFWQFHLSTMLMVTLTSAGMLLVNIKSFDRIIVDDGIFYKTRVWYRRDFRLGWPSRFIYRSDWIPAPESFDKDDLQEIPPRLSLLAWESFLLDLGVWIGIIGTTVFVGEWLIRRREARKT